MKKILLTISAVTFAILPVSAGIVSSETTSPEYLLNHGHSNAVVEMVQLSKAGATGEEYVTTYETEHASDSKPVKWFRKVFTYFDPALDDGTFMRHDTATAPSIDDL